jgi:hypothetical protein
MPVLAAVLLSTVCAAQSGPPTPPAPSSQILSASPSTCLFDVRLDFTGKVKFIPLPGNRAIAIFPGQFTTVTNVSNGKSVTLNTTGLAHLTFTADGGLIGTGTGRNLVSDPTIKLSFVVGNFSYAFDADNNLIQPFTLQGGEVTSICSLLQ